MLHWYNNKSMNECRNQTEDDNDEYLQDLVHKLATNAKHLEIKSTPTHATPPLEAIRRFLHQSDTVISYIRSDSVGFVQQDAPKQPREAPRKGWTDCTWVAMGH